MKHLKFLFAILILSSISNLSFAGKLSSLLPSSSSGGGGTYKGHQLITASGTWTVPAGVTKVDVIVIGGGTGGTSAGSLANYGYAEGGTAGNSGNIKIYLQIGVTPGNSVSVTVGAGGAGGANDGIMNAGSAGAASCFGTYCSTGGAVSQGSSFRGYTDCAGNHANTGSSGNACGPSYSCQVNASTITNISVAFPNSGTSSGGGVGSSCGNYEVAYGAQGGRGFVFPFNDLNTTTYYGSGGDGGSATCGCLGNTTNAGSTGTAGVIYVRW